MAELEKTYDYNIIDCPPSLGLITLNALVAADEVYIPMEAEILAIQRNRFNYWNNKPCQKTL